jgi:hypothetical protein
MGEREKLEELGGVLGPIRRAPLLADKRPEQRKQEHEHAECQGRAICQNADDKKAGRRKNDGVAESGQVAA